MPEKVTVSQTSGKSSEGAQTQRVEVGTTNNFYNGAYTRLVEVSGGGLTFNPSTIREIIVEIDRGIENLDTSDLDLRGIDISTKNALNNMSKEFFETVVEDELYPHFGKIDKFFALKANQPLAARADRVMKSLSIRIKAYGNVEEFQSILLKICDQIIDTHDEALEDRDWEVLLVLFYFYCNCGIGAKTEAEKNALSK